MLTTYAVLLNVRPDQAKTILEEILAEEDITGYEVNLISVAANGYTFSIDAEETRPNRQKLIRLCGELNLKTPEQEPEEQSLKRLKGKLATRPAFDPRGREGRFAREHRPEGTK